MTRVTLASLLLAAFAIPAAFAGAYVTTGIAPGVARAPQDGPCFEAGNAHYRMTTGADADVLVRIAGPADTDALRVQLVDDPAAAEFVLVDDSGASGGACQSGTARRVRVTADARPNADALAVAFSRAPAPHKIYVRSARFTDADAAALFAAIQHASLRLPARRTLAARE